jgi:hypothetical protein
MNKSYFVLLLLLFLTGQALALGVFERTFGEMGYENFTVHGPSNSGCFEALFLFPTDLNYLAGENYPIASLQLLLQPMRGKNFSVYVKLNDSNVGVFSTKSFACNEVCWLRVPLPKRLITKEENRLQLCLNNSIDVSQSALGKQSMIGLYRTVDFSKEDAFVEEAEKKEITIGEKTKITLILHNYGSASGFVEMKHARELAEDKEAYVVVDGNTHFGGFIKPGETITVSYTIRPRVVGAISLPPAILYYRNEFGEPQERFAKMLTITVREPENKISAFVMKEGEINKVGAVTELRLAVKNNGRGPLFNLAVSLALPEGLSLVAKPESTIDTIQPGETKYLEFSVRALKGGNYPIGCTVSYTDLNARESKCQQSSLLFREEKTPPELWIGLALLAAAVIIYTYIQSGK